VGFLLTFALMESKISYCGINKYMNKYENWYASITKNAKNRKTNEYTELHHIVPSSLGGTDEKHNLVELTAREHFICHWLLTKIHTGENRSKMIYALNGMKRTNKEQQRYETPITSRVYAKLKEEFSKTHSQTMKGRVPPNKGKPMSEEQKAKIRATAKSNPRIITDEYREKQRMGRIGSKQTAETKNKIKRALTGIPKGPMSTEEKEKRSLALLGKAKTKIHAGNIRNAVLGNRSINKDGVEKKVKNEVLQDWLDKGWNLGARKRKL
jgi:hypothetical protein